MTDIQRALTDIQDIRQQVARGALFRGFGPAVIAISSGLAIVVAGAQSVWPITLSNDAEVYLVVWVLTAVIAALAIGIEMRARSHRHHGGLADAMLLNAVEHFLPSGVAGAVLALTFWQFAPDLLWTLPGLWQVLVGVGIFAAVRFLPRPVTWIGGWYLLTGTTVLILGAEHRELEPWMMGLPFGIGQALLALLLWRAEGEVMGDRHGQ